jgi:hypothetical protein
MKKFLLIICISPIVALSQKFSVDRPDEILKQNPYASIYFVDSNNYKLIESILTIAKDKPNNFKPDTMNVDYYNSSGLKIKNIRYSNNKISTTAEYKYDDNGNLLSWHSFSKKSSTHALYKYNKRGQLLNTHKYTLDSRKDKIDTIEVSRMLFKYDADKLIQITNNSLGMDVIEKFSYQQNKLINKTGGFVSKQILYANGKNPASIIEYMGAIIDSTKIMGLEKFTYTSDGKLITDSSLTSSNLKSKIYQVNQYAYYENGILRNIFSSYKNLFRNVLFIFNNGKLKEVHLETNGNSAFLKFLIPYKIDEYYTYPIKYLEQFTYDNHGNRIAKKIFVNNELFSEVNYLITYRK